MSVTTRGVHSELKNAYAGCVYAVREENGYHDSDFYADVWNEETGKPETILYDTTRCGGSGVADVDITIENLRKLYSYWRKSTVEHLNRRNEEIAKTPQKGKSVIVVRGRKVPKGTNGEVFWIGEQYNQFSGCQEVKAGIVTPDGKKHFLLAEYLIVGNWEQYIVHGKERKDVIRKALLNNIPYYLRSQLKCKGEY